MIYISQTHCVQWPTGLLDLGHMHASGFPVALEPVFHRIFIWHLIGNEDSYKGNELPYPIMCQMKALMKSCTDENTAHPVTD